MKLDFFFVQEHVHDAFVDGVFPVAVAADEISFNDVELKHFRVSQIKREYIH